MSSAGPAGTKGNQKDALRTDDISLVGNDPHSVMRLALKHKLELKAWTSLAGIISAVGIVYQYGFNLAWYGRAEELGVHSTQRSNATVLGRITPGWYGGDSTGFASDPIWYMGSFDWVFSGFNIFTIAVLPWLIFSGWSAVRRSTLALLIATALLSNLLLGGTRNVITAGGFASGTAWSFGGLAMVWFGQLIPAVLTPIVLGGAISGFVSSPVRLQFASFFAILTFSYIILTFIAPAFVEATPFVQVIIRVVIYTLLLELAIATVRVCTKASFSRHIPRDRALALVGPTLLVSGMTGRFLSTSMDTLGETIGVAAAISVTELVLRLTLPSRDRVLLSWCLKWCPCLWQDRVRITPPSEMKDPPSKAGSSSATPSATPSSRAGGADVMPLAAAQDRTVSLDDTAPIDNALASRQSRLLSVEDDPTDSRAGTLSPARAQHEAESTATPAAAAAAVGSQADVNPNPVAGEEAQGAEGVQGGAKTKVELPVPAAAAAYTNQDTNGTRGEPADAPVHLPAPTIFTHLSAADDAGEGGGGGNGGGSGGGGNSSGSGKTPFFADIVSSTRAVRVGAAVQMAMRRTAREAQDIHAYFTMLTLDTMAEDIGILTSLPFALLMRLPPRVGGEPLTVGDILARIGGQYLLELLTDLAPPLLMLGVNTCCGVRWRRVSDRAVRRTVREEMLKAQLPQNDDGVERVLSETPIAGSRASGLTQSDLASASAQLDMLDDAVRTNTGDFKPEHGDASQQDSADIESGHAGGVSHGMDMRAVSAREGDSQGGEDTHDGGLPPVPPMPPAMGASAHMALRLAAQQSEFVNAAGSVRSPEGGGSQQGFGPSSPPSSGAADAKQGSKPDHPTTRDTQSAAILRGTYVSSEVGAPQDSLAAELVHDNGRAIGACDVVLRKDDPDVVAHRATLLHSYKKEIRRIHRDALWQPIEKQQLLALAVEGYRDPLAHVGAIAQPRDGAQNSTAPADEEEDEPAMVLWQPVYRVADLTPMQRWVAWLSISSEVLAVRLGRAWETRFKGFTRLFLIGVISAVLLNARNFAGPFLRCKLLDGDGRTYFDFCDDQTI